MDKLKQPGIIFQGIYLIELDFKLKPEPPKELHSELDFKYEKKISPDGKELTAFLSVDAAHNKENNPFDFTFTLAAKFKTGEKPNLSLEEFADNQAPAYFIPYVREVISNITSRSLVPTLNINPINVKAMLDSKKNIKTDVPSMPKDK